jgi:hypothetical protein
MIHAIVLVQGDYGVPRKGKSRAYDPAAGAASRPRQTEGMSLGGFPPTGSVYEMPASPWWMAVLAVGAGLLAVKPRPTKLGRVVPSAIAAIAALSFLSSNPPLRGGLAGVDCGCGCNGAPGGCGS